MVKLSYCLTIVTAGILRYQIAKILRYFLRFSDGFFRFSLLVTTVGGTVEFVRRVRSKARQREFNIECEDVARLLTANLVLLVNKTEEDVKCTRRLNLPYRNHFPSLLEGLGYQFHSKIECRRRSGVNEHVD